MRIRAADPRPREGAHARVRFPALLHRVDPLGRRHFRSLVRRGSAALDDAGRRFSSVEDDHGRGARSAIGLGPRHTGPHTFHVGTNPLDTLGRPLHDLRISVTDRCNFRCVYCMPKEIFGKDFQFLPRAEILTFEEIERLAQIGDLDLTLTTNGSLLAQKARALAAAGLKRVTVSLDSLDDATFKQMNDADFPVAKVLAGIDAARAAGLAPIKINMVTKRGVNESSIVPMARYFKGTGMTLRFIEFMDVGSTNGWRLDDVVPADRKST